MGMSVTENMKGSLIMGYNVCFRYGQYSLFISDEKQFH
jgi:hypothetical protein